MSIFARLGSSTEKTCTHKWGPQQKNGTIALGRLNKRDYFYQCGRCGAKCFDTIRAKLPKRGRPR